MTSDDFGVMSLLQILNSASPWPSWGYTRVHEFHRIKAISSCIYSSSPILTINNNICWTNGRSMAVIYSTVHKTNRILMQTLPYSQSFVVGAKRKRAIANSNNTEYPNKVPTRWLWLELQINGTNPFVARSTREELALESNSIGSANKNSVHAKINTPTIQLLNSPFIRNRMQSEANQSSHVSSCVGVFCWLLHPDDWWGRGGT